MRVATSWVANDIWALLVLTLAAGISEVAPRPDPSVPAPSVPKPSVVRVAPAPKPNVEAPPPARILVNTATTLYDLDPESLRLTELGLFEFPDGPDVMTDIALDREGRLWGVSFDAIYAIDLSTLAAHRLGTVPNGTNALGVVESANRDVLLAAGHKSRTVYRIDTKAGTATPVGDLRIGRSSGDITWVPGVGGVIVLRHEDGADTLARLDPHTFAATPIGSIGFSHVLGLAWLRDHLIGVTETGEIIDIDPATGAGRLRDHHEVRFFGAAVGVPARLPAPMKHRIAILGLEAGSPDVTQVAQQIGDAVRAADGRVGQAPAHELVDEKLLANCKSEAPSCMAVIGRNLGADQLLWGRVDRASRGPHPAGGITGYRVRLTLLDVSQREVVATWTQFVPDADVEPTAIARLARHAYEKLTSNAVIAADDVD